MKFTTPTRIFLGGAVCATLVLAGGLGYSTTLENKVRQLEAECAADAQDKPFGFAIICEADHLSSLPSTSAGIAQQIRDAATDVWRAKDRTYAISLGILALSALPIAWYFLLARLSEISKAIRGA